MSDAQDTTPDETTEHDVQHDVDHQDASPQQTGNDALGEAMQRLDEADPGDTDEVLAAGTQAHEELQNRLRDSESS